MSEPKLESNTVLCHTLRAFVWLGYVSLGFLASLLIILLFMPNFLVLVLYFMLLGLVPYPLLIWGVALFWRYRRRLKACNVRLSQRLWLETMLFNAMCVLGFAWLSLFYSGFSGLVLMASLFWPLIAIVLAARAYRLSSHGPKPIQ